MRKNERKETLNMGTPWTSEQLRAIESPARKMLVCAAAGSGKTAVLTEKIIRYVCDKDNPGNVSRILVVTFTRASAADLRSKIRSALEEKLAEEPSEHLAREVLAVSGARISTIHSFCYDLIRAEGAALGVSGNVRLMDENEEKQLMQGVMEDTIRERYTVSPTFGNLVESLVGYRNDSLLGGSLMELYDKLVNLPKGIEFVRECAEKEALAAKNDFFLSESGAAVARDIISTLLLFKKRYDRTLELIPPEHHYYSPVTADLNGLNALINALSSSYSDSRNAYFDAKTFIKLPSNGMKGYDAEKTAFKTLRARYKNYLSSLDALFAQTPEEAAYCLARHSEMLFELYETEKAFESRLNAAKRKADVCSFADLEQLSVKLLYNGDGTFSHVARSVSQCFDMVFIDEYQDVNETQRMIFDAVSCDSRCFRVGDIKQNIYAFRGSDPAIIDRLRQEYETDGLAETENVFMSSNFRSSKTVLDYVNEVFEPLFRGGKFRYEDSDKLHCGKKDKDFSKEAKVTLLMCLNGSKKEGTYAVPEEVAVADEIERIVGKVTLENGKTIKYGNIALLFRNYSTHAAPFIKELERRGIPVSVKGKRSLFAQSHVSLVLNILQTADNPMKDIPLCAVLFSPVFRMTADMLAIAKKEGRGTLWQCLKAASEKHGGIYTVAYDKISQWRELARTESCDGFLRKLYTSDGIRPLLIAQAEKDFEKRNVDDDLNLIYDMARSFSSSGNKDLSAFVADLEEASKKNLKVPGNSGSENSVTVMSSHGSKGLEFPVCFVCKANAGKSRGDSTNRLQFTAEGGVGIPLTDPRGFVLINTPTREALRLSAISAETGEEERILYVALTRAMERLYVTAGSVKPDAEYEAECELLYGGLNLPCGDTNILHVTLRAAKNLPRITNCITVMPTAEDPALTTAPAAEPEKKPPVDEKKAQAMAKTIVSRLAFEYPEPYLSRIPAKISVSDLSPSVLNEAMPSQSEGEAELATIGKADLTDFADAPAFIRSGSAVSATEAGTATHQFLQFCDIGNARLNGVEAEADRLTDLGFISERQRGCLRIDELVTFINSPFASRIDKANSAKREFRFNCFMPAHKLTDSEKLSDLLKGRQLAVQGVIDGFFLEGDKVYLFDYKTDRVPKGKSKEEAKEIFAERYRWQLSCYAEALKRIFSRKISGALIYSTALGEAFEVNADMLDD
ncbi:MAG: hypothetical protein E7619_02190 [Ruminococcaceae bacterium]|nr:hypothetical protein [Oscillospiraceae bacterium]